MTENSVYFPGQLITITGSTSEIIPFESIQFTITDSIGNLVTSGNLFASDGQFQTSIFLTSVNPSYGVYTVDIEYGDHVESTTFNVVEESADESESVLLVSDSIVFNIDKSKYLHNDFMTLSGTITNFDSDNLPYTIKLYTLISQLLMELLQCLQVILRKLLVILGKL